MSTVYAALSLLLERESELLLCASLLQCCLANVLSSAVEGQ